MCRKFSGKPIKFHVTTCIHIDLECMFVSLCLQLNMTSLAWASGRGHTDVVRLLVQKGAKVNTSDKVCYHGNIIQYDQFGLGIWKRSYRGYEASGTERGKGQHIR